VDRCASQFGKTAAGDKPIASCQQLATTFGPPAAVDNVMVDICNAIHEILMQHRPNQVEDISEPETASPQGARRVEGHNFPCPVPFRNRDHEMKAMRDHLGTR
jgi:hypothetical protein